MTEKDNQEFLKKADQIDHGLNKIMYRIAAICYVIFMCFIFVAIVYYVVSEFRGNGNPHQLTMCSVTFLALAAIPVCGRLMDLFFEHFFKKNTGFDPRTMELPARGSVGLEDALHKLSTQTAVIVWDVIWGCVVFSELFLLAVGMGYSNRILFLLVCEAVLIAVGHTVFHLLWKRRSFIKKMIKNTSKVMKLDDPKAYAVAIEESLKRGVWSYEKELILTDEYILGSVESDTFYTPVAIQRAQITEFVFFYRRIVAGGMGARIIGILRCVSDGKKLVDFVLSPGIKAEKIKKILGYYQISWREEKLNYK